MQSIGDLIPLLWKILAKKKCAINVCTIDNEMTVSIIRKRKIKRFTGTDSFSLIPHLTQYLQMG